jgi:hypothetical protein
LGPLVELPDVPEPRVHPRPPARATSLVEPDILVALVNPLVMRELLMEKMIGKTAPTTKSGDIPQALPERSTGRERTPRLTLRAHSPARGTPRRLLTLGLLLLVALPSVASAQMRRTILWVVENEPGASMAAERVAGLFAELLVSADDATHVVDTAGLTRWLSTNGFPAPPCLAGAAPCPDLAQAMAEELRLDVIATVRVFGDGQRMTLTVQGAAGGPTRTLEFVTDNLRATAFAVVTDFVGATGTLTVTTRPTGAQVLLDGSPAGATPFQSQLPAGIYRLALELEGYQLVEEVVELRPSQARLLDIDLARLFADLTVRSRTLNATVFLDDRAVGPPNRPLEVPPGEHVVRLEAPDHVTETRAITLEAGEVRTLQVDLRESPEAIRARRMGYIYERPFFLRGGFRFSGSRAGFGGAEGSVSGVGLSVECPRSSSGTCAEAGIPVNSVGLDVGLGYSFKIFELLLVSFAYQAAQIGGSSGDGRTLTLDDGRAATTDITGRVDGTQRLEVRPLALGARVLLTDTWSVFAHGGVGWYSEFFEVDTIEGLQGQRNATGDFSRTGWNWLVDVGGRYHLNDTLFIEVAVGLGDDLTHDDVDLSTTITAGLGITWEDFLGIDRLGGDDGAAPPSDPGGAREVW